MQYADGAGRNIGKLCLEGTRSEILGEITDWVNNIDDNTTRVFWLHGTAGSGKSAIAHTIAHHFYNLKRLGSFFCFDRNRVAERRHEKIFATIARDLADLDQQLRTALAAAVHHNTSLSKTPDVLQQWEELIVKPVSAKSGAMVGPIVIIIDALDESGDDDSRRHLLRILAGKQGNAEGHIINLPPQFRILVTSRAQRDIRDAFQDVAHIRQESMDNIAQDIAKRDISHYISGELSNARLGSSFQKIVAALSSEADGLFEWARLACAFVIGENGAGAGFTPEECFQAIMTRRKEISLLDNMYRLTLETIFPQGQRLRDLRIQRFKSVIAQILGTMEPLSLTSLDMMRRHFPNDEGIDIRTIIDQMGALLSGTTDPSVPIRALHASFPDFLLDHKRSGEYFIDLQSIHNNLAFSCLNVMKDQLRFNICELPSSYLPNSEVSDLGDRIKKHISSELVYSCRFWPAHVCDTPLNTPLVEVVGELFNGMELLFWFEVLSLLKAINTCASSLSSLIRWMLVREPIPFIVCILKSH